MKESFLLSAVECARLCFPVDLVFVKHFELYTLSIGSYGYILKLPSIGLNAGPV